MSVLSKRKKKYKKYSWEGIKIFFKTIIRDIKTFKSTPKQTPFEIIKWRVAFYWLGIFICFVLLFTRLVWVMVLERDFYIEKGDDRIVRTVTESIERGNIVDRNGEPLASSIPVRAITFETRVLKEYLKDAKHINKEEKYKEYLSKLNTVCSLVDYDCNKIKRVLESNNNRVFVLARQVPDSITNYIRSLQIKGLFLTEELKRYYPTGEVNAQLLGIISIDGHGTEGIERVYDKYLLSSPEKKRLKQDKKGNVIENLGVIKKGQAANELVLSIDERLQTFAYKSLKYAVDINQATSGSLVLVDVHTGEILAMVNSPSYDPNDRANYESYKARNRAATDMYEPGSTVKPLVVLSALEKKITYWNEIFDTKPFIVNGKIIRDSHYMEKANVFDLLKYSSNTGMARIALRMEASDILTTLKDFGFGKKTATKLLGETNGVLPKRKRWSNIEKATLGFGYGLTVSPLQLAQAYTALANGGELVPLSILKLDTPPKKKRIAKQADVKKVLTSLEAVVEDGGTGEQARIAGYRVGGKTGTAKVAIAGGYGKDYVGTFAGIAPMSNPRFAMVVIINEPRAGKYYGGTVSGPVFSQVMERALQLYNVPPDDLKPDGSIMTLKDKRTRDYNNRRKRAKLEAR